MIAESSFFRESRFEDPAARDVLIVRAGPADTHALVAALDQIGARSAVASDPADVLLADRLILAGGGSFGEAMSELSQRGLVSALRERFWMGRSTLAIGLGFHVLARGSEESPGVSGLAVVDAIVRKLPEIGREWKGRRAWSEVEPHHVCRTITDGRACFESWYGLLAIPRGWRGGTLSGVEGTPVAAIEQGDGDRLVVGTQFRPELSGPWGIDVVRRWLVGRPSLAAIVPDGGPEGDQSALTVDAA